MIDVVAFDIETTPFSMFAPEFNFSGFFNGGEPVYLDDLHTCRQLILNCKKDTIFIAHNLQFDFNFIFPEGVELPNKVKWRLFAVNGEFPRFACLEIRNQYREGKKKKTKRIRVYFIDLMNFVKFKLADLMKIYTPDLEKTEEFGLERNLADIKATYRIFREHFLETHVVRKREIPFLSTPARAFNDLKSRTGYEWEDKNDKGKKIRHKNIVKIEQMSYKGGIVYVNPKFRKKKIKNAKYYDINSMYPAVMREMKVPVGFQTKESGLDMDEKECEEFIKQAFEREDTYCLFHVKLTTKEPILATKINDKLEVPKGDIQDWFTEDELYWAIFNPKRKKIRNLQIISYVVYKAKKGMFAPFVDHHYTIKKNYSKLKAVEDTNKYDPIITDAKLNLNSAYGRFGMKEKETKFFKEEEADLMNLLIEEKSDHYVDPQGRKWNCRSENGLFYLERKTFRESSKAVTVIASIVTGRARALIMQTFEPNHTIYIDTDSQTRTDEIETGEELGEWKIEKEGVIQTFGKKHYKFDEDLKCKGVPKKAVEREDGSFEFYRVVRPREAKRRKLPLFSVIRVIKRLKASK